MREQLCERNFLFPSLCKFRPELGDALADVDLLFLQHMQDTGGADSLRRRPDQNKRVSGPRFFTMHIAKPAVEIDDRFAVLPNRYRRA